MKIKISRIDKSLPLPEYQTEGSVAFDIYTRQDAVFEPGEVKTLPANFIVQVPDGYFLLMAPRSSLYKKGLQASNCVGVIDRDYRGPEDEVHMSLRNITAEIVKVKKGDRLMQGLVLTVEKAEWQEAEIEQNKSRGGFGSTG